jgi:hypothetical protein
LTVFCQYLDPALPGLLDVLAGYHPGPAPEDGVVAGPGCQ